LGQLYCRDSTGFNTFLLVSRNCYEPFTDEFFGIALPKGSPNREFVNNGLASLIDSGSYAEIYRKWFDRDPRPLPEKIEGVGSDGIPDSPTPRRPARWTVPKAA